jgi:hypothetical protein
LLENSIIFHDRNHCRNLLHLRNFDFWSHIPSQWTMDWVSQICTEWPITSDLNPLYRNHLRFKGLWTGAATPSQSNRNIRGLSPKFQIGRLSWPSCWSSYFVKSIRVSRINSISLIHENLPYRIHEHARLLCTHNSLPC